jgi:predicted dehydrogenase
MSASPAFPFAVIGVDHPHVFDQTREMLRAGCALSAFHSPRDDVAAAFHRAFPDARRVADERAILEDDAIRLILGAGIYAERAPMAVRAMRHGKDVMLDKPGATSLAQLDALIASCRDTGRFTTIFYSEHVTQRATIKAGELVADGAIGHVVQTIGIGPHRLGKGRPDWYFRRDLYGGILTDIATHQIEQFLFLTGSESADIVASRVANFSQPDRPEFEDFGEVLLAGSSGASGYIRVDWFTPDGLPVWGDGRLFVLGSEGQIEVRKYVDLAGRQGGDHLFLVDRAGVRHIDCSDVVVDYGERLRDDVLNRTDTALDQTRCFLATRLALAAEAGATRADRSV